MLEGLHKRDGVGGAKWRGGQSGPFKNKKPQPTQTQNTLLHLAKHKSCIKDLS